MAWLRWKAFVAGALLMEMRGLEDFVLGRKRRSTIVKEMWMIGIATPVSRKLR